MPSQAFCRFSCLLLIMLLSPLATAESILEYHLRQCDAGQASSCERAKVMQKADDEAKRVEELGDAFAANINRRDFETDNKPELEKAYLVILQDYFIAEKENGVEQTLPEDLLWLCAGHYHDHWRNKKLWWPTDEEQKPDWSTIYYYVVDHYYGYCKRNFLSGANNS